ncbi:vascular endothelial growth factor receptor 1-like, partial [Augochlora pura]
MCTIASDQRVTYNVVLDDLSSLPRPFMIATLLHVLKGKSLHLTCRLFMWKNSDCRIFWIPFQQSTRVSTWTNIYHGMPPLDLKVTSLEIMNMTYSDEGVYECKVTRGVLKRSLRAFVHVYDKFANFGIISTNDTVLEGDDWELTCAASVENYLNDIEWYNGTGLFPVSGNLSFDIRAKTT